MMTYFWLQTIRSCCSAGLACLKPAGAATPAPNPAPDMSWGGPGSLAVGDINADGRPDLAAASAYGTVSVLLGNGDGTFAAPRTLFLASDQGGALSVTAGDFNGDGRLDLA